MPALSTIEGLGDKAADQLYEAAKDGPFLSKDDLRTRSTVSYTHLVILNLMVVTSLFPTTGVTLPFFSYGGTATVFLLVEIGMVLNVEKESRFKREREMREARLE